MGFAILFKSPQRIVRHLQISNQKLFHTHTLHAFYIDVTSLKLSYTILYHSQIPLNENVSGILVFSH